MKTKEVFEFGPFRLVPSERLLLRDSEPVTLTPKVFDLLVVLVENPGTLLVRDALLKSLWPDSFIEENNLTVNVSTLRKVLGEGAGKTQYIETVPKKGYRFIAEVRAVPAIVAGALEAEPAPIPPAGLDGPSASGKRAVRSAYLVAGVAVIVLTVAITIGLARFTGHEPAALLEALPLTSYPGVESSPTISPDGTRVAFTWYPPDHAASGIYVKVVGQGDAIRLTDAAMPSSSPAWSPDGTQLAFLHDKAGSEYDVLLMPAVGGASRKIASITSPRGRHGPILNWSPDGKWLLLTSRAPAENLFRIEALSLETGQRKPLTSPPALLVGDSQPSLSPDGRKLVFGRHVTSIIGDLFVLDISPSDMTPMGQPRRLTFLENEPGGAAWMPNGREIVFSAGPPLGGSRLFRLPIGGAAKPPFQPIPYIGIDGIAPAISRTDGRLPIRLIYEKYSHRTSLWRLDLAGGKLEHGSTPWAQSTRTDQSPDISPDGKKVTFASTRSGSWEIWTCEISGTNCMQLTNFGSSFSRSPRWSPDGTEIVFDSRIRGNPDLFVVPASGGKPRQLTLEPSSDVYPSWSADGRFIYFSSNRAGNFQIWKVPAAGGTASLVAPVTGEVPRESRDGQWVYFIGRSPEAGIWRMPSSGGPEERVISPAAPGHGFVLAKSGIYFGLDGPQGRSLAYRNFASGKTTTLITHESLDWNGLALSPDESWLLYVQAIRATSDLMLVDNFR